MFSIERVVFADAGGGDTPKMLDMPNAKDMTIRAGKLNR